LPLEVDGPVIATEAAQRSRFVQPEHGPGRQDEVEDGRPQIGLRDPAGVEELDHFGLDVRLVDV
jgi:hypothetical protein